MFRLVAKDLKVIRFFWLPALFFYAFFISSFLHLNLLYLVVNLILCFLLVLAVPIVEDRWGLDPFLCSLPVKRSALVGARYLSAGLTIIVCLAAFLSTAPLLAGLFSLEGARPEVLLTPAGALSFLLPMIFILSLFLPLYFRLGLGKGVMALMIAGLALVILLAGAARLTAGFLRRPLSALFPLDADIMIVPYKPFLPLAAGLKQSLGAAGFWALLLAVTAVVVALSLWLSIRFYVRREF